MAALRNREHARENAIDVEDTIRSAAEIIFDSLYHEGAITLEKLRKTVSREAPFFDWGIGWLVGKGDIEIIDHEGSFTVRRKGPAPVVIPLRGN